MSFQLNTNIGSMKALTINVENRRNFDDSLSRLSSGLRINKAADDASGMVIADSLRSQANSLGQAIRNANDTISMIQIADKAMDEQMNIIQTIKTKATQAAQDGQTTKSRLAIQQDITRLLEALDTMGLQASFNGLRMMSGIFNDKGFQIGGYSNEAVKGSFGATMSQKIGHVRYETTTISGEGNLTLSFQNIDGRESVSLESVTISTSAGTGIGALSEVINKNSSRLGLRANWNLQSTTNQAVVVGDVISLSINGIKIGAISGVVANDSDGKLLDAINRVKEETGIEGFIDTNGRLNLRSIDGRGLELVADSSSFGVIGGVSGSNYGKLTLSKLSSEDIVFSGGNFSSLENSVGSVVNLASLVNGFNVDIASAVGANANSTIANSDNMNGLGIGVSTLKGAMVTMDIAESSLRALDRVRAELGGLQINLVASINNIATTQMNVKASESQLRDVDFASESANFQKENILAQSGSFALTQANQVQQNVTKLFT